MPASWLRRDDTVIQWQQENPKKIGSLSYDRYEKYKGSRTVTEAKKNGAETCDFKHDHSKGFLSVLDVIPKKAKVKLKTKSDTSNNKIDNSATSTSNRKWGAREKAAAALAVERKSEIIALLRVRVPVEKESTSNGVKMEIITKEIEKGQHSGAPCKKRKGVIVFEEDGFESPLRTASAQSAMPHCSLEEYDQEIATTDPYMALVNGNLHPADKDAVTDNIDPIAIISAVSSSPATVAGEAISIGVEPNGCIEPQVIESTQVGATGLPKDSIDDWLDWLDQAAFDPALKGGDENKDASQSAKMIKDKAVEMSLPFVTGSSITSTESPLLTGSSCQAGSTPNIDKVMSVGINEALGSHLDDNRAEVLFSEESTLSYLLTGPSGNEPHAIIGCTDQYLVPHSLGVPKDDGKPCEQTETFKKISPNKFKCLVCGKCFRGEMYVRKHLKKEHPDVVTPRSPQFDGVNLRKDHPDVDATSEKNPDSRRKDLTTPEEEHVRDSAAIQHCVDRPDIGFGEKAPAEGEPALAHHSAAMQDCVDELEVVKANGLDENAPFKEPRHVFKHKESIPEVTESRVVESLATQQCWIDQVNNRGRTRSPILCRNSRMCARRECWFEQASGSYIDDLGACPAEMRRAASRRRQQRQRSETRRRQSRSESPRQTNKSINCSRRAEDPCRKRSRSFQESPSRQKQTRKSRLHSKSPAQATSFVENSSADSSSQKDCETMMQSHTSAVDRFQDSRTLRTLDAEHLWRCTDNWDLYHRCGPASLRSHTRWNGSSAHDGRQEELSKQADSLHALQSTPVPKHVNRWQDWTPSNPSRSNSRSQRVLMPVSDIYFSHHAVSPNFKCSSWSVSDLVQQLVEGHQTIENVEVMEVCEVWHHLQVRYHCKSGNRRLLAYKRYAKILNCPDLMIPVRIKPMDEHFRRGYTTVTRGETVRLRNHADRCQLTGPSWAFPPDKMRRVISFENMQYGYPITCYPMG